MSEAKLNFESTDLQASSLAAKGQHIYGNNASSFLPEFLISASKTQLLSLRQVFMKNVESNNNGGAVAVHSAASAFIKSC